MLLQRAVIELLVAPPPKSPMRMPRVLPFAIRFSSRVAFRTPPPSTSCDPSDPVTSLRAKVEAVQWKARNPLPLPWKVLSVTLTAVSP